MGNSTSLPEDVSNASGYKGMPTDAKGQVLTDYEIPGITRAGKSISLQHLTTNTQECLKRLARLFGSKLTCTSAFRTPKFNSTLKNSVPNSQHIFGKAVDISTGNMTDKTKAYLVECALKAGFSTVGFYNTFIHLDIRDAGTTFGKMPGWAKPVMAALFTRGMEPRVAESVGEPEEPAEGSKPKGSSATDQVASAAAKADPLSPNADAGSTGGGYFSQKFARGEMGNDSFADGMSYQTAGTGVMSDATGGSPWDKFIEGTMVENLNNLNSEELNDYRNKLSNKLEELKSEYKKASTPEAKKEIEKLFEKTNKEFINVASEITFRRAKGTYVEPEPSSDENVNKEKKTSDDTNKSTSSNSESLKHIPFSEWMDLNIKNVSDENLNNQLIYFQAVYKEENVKTNNAGSYKGKMANDEINKIKKEMSSRKKDTGMDKRLNADIETYKNKSLFDQNFENALNTKKIDKQIDMLDPRNKGSRDGAFGVDPKSKVNMVDDQIDILDPRNKGPRDGAFGVNAKNKIHLPKLTLIDEEEMITPIVQDQMKVDKKVNTLPTINMPTLDTSSPSKSSDISMPNFGIDNLSATHELSMTHIGVMSDGELKNSIKMYKEKLNNIKGQYNSGWLDKKSYEDRKKIIENNITNIEYEIFLREDEKNNTYKLPTIDAFGGAGRDVVTDKLSKDSKPSINPANAYENQTKKSNKYNPKLTNPHLIEAPYVHDFSSSEDLQLAMNDISGLGRNNKDSKVNAVNTSLVPAPLPERGVGNISLRPPVSTTETALVESPQKPVIMPEANKEMLSPKMLFDCINSIKTSIDGLTDLLSDGIKVTNFNELKENENKESIMSVEIKESKVLDEIYNELKMTNESNQKLMEQGKSMVKAKGINTNLNNGLDTDQRPQQKLFNDNVSTI